MIPTLYSETETAFASNGIGKLSEAISCVVTEERNGEYELEMEYPVSGKYYSEIKRSRIIFAVPADGKSGQPFRIYRITKPMDGIVIINAEHISYQLSLIPVTPFEADSSTAARQGIWNHAVGVNPFDHWSDINSLADYKVTVPQSLRACLGGVRGSFLDVYGGEFEWDTWHVKIHAQRGVNRNVTIRYGKNLTDFQQDENIQDVITGILPYWYNGEDDKVVLLNDFVVMSSYANNYPFRRVVPVDFTENFEEEPDQTKLRNAAQSYITSHNIGIPKINISVSFVPLYMTEEYKNKISVERVNLCDTVSVYFEKLGISATAKVIKTTYNVLLDRYDSIELGDAKSSFGDTLIKQQADIENVEETVAKKAEFLQKAINEATKLISGGLGGYVVIEPNPDTGFPEEILIMDSPDKDSAINVIRLNKNGIGFSTHGYNPTAFDTAWTIDGKFNANYIATGQIDTTLLKSGVIADHNGNTTYNLDTGQLKSKNLVIDTKTDGGSLEIKSENFNVTPSGDVSLNDATLSNANASGTFKTSRKEGNTTYSTEESAGVLKFNKNDGTVADLSVWDAIYPYPSTPSSQAVDSFAIHMHDNYPLAIGTPTVSGEQYFDWYYRFAVNDPSKSVGVDEWVYVQDLFVADNIRFESRNGPQIGCTVYQGNYGIFADGPFVVHGDMWCDTGQKYRAVETEHHGKVGLSAMESPEPVFSDFGSGVIDSEGRCIVDFESIFAETVDLSCDYKVFHTQTSPGNIDFIEKRSDCFVVHGEPATTFDWIVYAKQKEYSNTRFTKFEN